MTTVDRFEGTAWLDWWANSSTKRWGESGCAGEVAGRKAGDAACHGQELGGQRGPHLWQGLDEGRVRVFVEHPGDTFVHLGRPARAAAEGQSATPNRHGRAALAREP
jgi:hypothetical protein